jgi:NDP-sugar pyrophosphorylase family protein
MPAKLTALQALILCGPGSSFPTFTTNPDEHPKALLAVANRPMVWYPLQYAYKMGISSMLTVGSIPPCMLTENTDLVAQI